MRYLLYCDLSMATEDQQLNIQKEYAIRKTAIEKRQKINVEAERSCIGRAF